MARYVALLRGINVGGNNLIRMPALAACFAEHGFERVSTYIQSGNVVFDAPRASRGKLTDEVEAVIRASFDHYDASVVVRSGSEMRSTVADAPAGFGDDPARFRYDVVFLKAPLTARAAIREIPTKEDVDVASAGAGVVYFSRLSSRATSSRLSRVASMPIYRQMTIRNWNTTTKLAELAAPPPR